MAGRLGDAATARMETPFNDVHSWHALYHALKKAAPLTRVKDSVEESMHLMAATWQSQECLLGGFMGLYVLSEAGRGVALPLVQPVSVVEYVLRPQGHYQPLHADETLIRQRSLQILHQSCKRFLVEAGKTDYICVLI
jgi:hypothetical protein